MNEQQEQQLINQIRQALQEIHAQLHGLSLDDLAARYDEQPEFVGDYAAIVIGRKRSIKVLRKLAADRPHYPQPFLQMIAMRIEQLEGINELNRQEEVYHEHFVWSQSHLLPLPRLPEGMRLLTPNVNCRTAERAALGWATYLGELPTDRMPYTNKLNDTMFDVGEYLGIQETDVGELLYDEDWR
jgi:hypothetical protein